MSELSNIVGENALTTCHPIRRYKLDGNVVEIVQLIFLSEEPNNKTRFFTFDISMNEKIFDSMPSMDLSSVKLLSKVVNVTDGIGVPILCTLEPCDCKFIMDKYRNMMLLQRKGNAENDSISENNQK